jgi:cob(I)alamin adenosyltransferase
MLLPRRPWLGRFPWCRLFGLLGCHPFLSSVPPDGGRPRPLDGYPNRVGKIYTKTGDDGSTGLLYGGRISKSDPAAEAYGTVDETVAQLGLARALSDNPALLGILLNVQRELFVVGADLATNPKERAKLKPEVSLVTEAMVQRLERLIDEHEAHLPNEFIVPGQNPVSAALDVARSTCRRAERRAVELREAGREVNPEAAKYLNRLSDLLFALARWQAGGPEQPSRSR